MPDDGLTIPYEVDERVYDIEDRRGGQSVFRRNDGVKGDSEAYRKRLMRGRN